MTKTGTYAEQMREAAQIDETGMSPLRIKHYGRDAMMRKTSEWFGRAAEWESMSTAQKNKLIAASDDTDYCSICGKTGCSCDNGN